jgi:protein-S-isoprenylcysteine O-methyltransferase Ste14
MKDELVNNPDAPTPVPAELLPKARRTVWWNWLRVRLPWLLLIGLLVLVHPRWSWWWWSLPIFLLGQSLRVWAAGYIHKDRQLATGGPYALCRHPLYLGTFLSCIGLCGLVGSWLVMLIFALIFTAVYIPTIRQEEAFLATVYGDDFQAYTKQVPAFFPRLWRRPAYASQGWQWSWLVRNEEHLTWIALVVFFLLMAAKQRLLS